MQRHHYHKGNLSITKDIEVICEEPAIPMCIKSFRFFSKNTRRLFAIPPANDKIKNPDYINEITLREFKSNTELKKIDILAIPYKKITIHLNYIESLQLIFPGQKQKIHLFLLPIIFCKLALCLKMILNIIPSNIII